MSFTWQSIHDEALRRIQSREWPPGELIPNESDLAAELGCARATVNRALRTLAEDGWLERKRKAGTRVARAPQRQARLAIPVIRKEIEDRGHVASHRLLSRVTATMPPHPQAALGLADEVEAQHVRTLYQADGRPFALEDRWVHLAAAPGFAQAPLQTISPNEWLVQHVAFSHGTLDYSAGSASPDEAAHLNCPEAAPVMVLERRTFGPDQPVTYMRLTYAPGHRLHLSI